MMGLRSALKLLGEDPRFPDTKASNMARRHKALRRRRAKNRVAKQSRKVNRP